LRSERTMMANSAVWLSASAMARTTPNVSGSPWTLLRVAMYAMAVGYRVTYEDQAKQLAELKTAIEKLKASGVSLSRPQESWVCVLQSLPKELIPQELYLGGPKWMQDNISQDNLWFNKPLTAKARELIPGTLKRD
ncbi:MAG: hypothetical protein K2X27_06065, partial [Candidatus Obscuribacterales bacterium]|nr:hypothetical protein [Candidatus Obscuribacterales bacterium]